jgi:hypothetical protein
MATGLAAVLVLVALDVPDRLGAVRPAAFLRLPLEALVYLGLVLALPRGRGRLRTVLALVAGLLLGVVAVFRLLDIGFVEALGRRFDPLVDWRYTRPLASLLRDSFGDGLGTALFVVAALTAVLLLVLLPLAVLRLTRVAVDHRRPAGRALAAVASLWLVFAVLDVRTGGGALAADDSAPYLYGQLSRIPSAVRDQRAFAEAAAADPPPTPGQGLLSGLQGKDVLFVFVESYGRVAVEGSWFSPGVDAVLAKASKRLSAAGFGSRSAWFTSPTFGGISWLAHSTLQSGLWVDSQQRYDVLVKSPRLTLSRFFGRAGWRTVDVVPSDTRDWPQGAFYHYDHIYDSRNIGYKGPRFGYPTMPDQFTLEAFRRLELVPRHRRPVMAEIDLLSSHTPWSRTPRMIDESAIGDGSVYDGMPEQLPSEGDIWPSPTRVQEAYGKSIQYSLRALTTFLTTHGDDNTVVVFMGDHQPASIVSGEGASHQVPVAIVARDPAVLDRVSPWGWGRGIRPASDAPVWRMDQFRDRFLAAFGPRGGGTAQAGSTP